MSTKKELQETAKRMYLEFLDHERSTIGPELLTSLPISIHASMSDFSELLFFHQRIFFYKEEEGAHPMTLSLEPNSFGLDLYSQMIN